MTASPHATLEILSDATLGLPDADAAAAMLLHAEQCQECLDNLASLTAVESLLAASPRLEMPAAVLVRMETALRDEAGARAAAEDITRPASNGGTELSRDVQDWLGAPQHTNESITADEEAEAF